MKKNITILSAVVLLTSSAILTSCKKDDVTAPVVTLAGGDMTISLQGTFSDPGATANDKKDGDLSTSVSGNVDVNHTGVYELTYTATDAAGNAGTAVRNVTVVNDLDAMTGTYAVAGGDAGTGANAYTYVHTVTASSTVNKRLIFGKFGNYAGNTGIYIDVNNTGTTSPLTLPSQTAIQVGTAPDIDDRTFSGTGARSSATTFSLTYTETTSVNTGSYTEVMVKQ